MIQQICSFFSLFNKDKYNYHFNKYNLQLFFLYLEIRVNSLKWISRLLIEEEMFSDPINNLVLGSLERELKLMVIGKTLFFVSPYIIQRVFQVFFIFY